jgi:drug/metabolite transporter (DMT)-like permease
MGQTLSYGLFVMLAWGIGDVIVAILSRRIGERNVICWSMLFSWVVLIPLIVSSKAEVTQAVTSLDFGQWLGLLFLGWIQILGFLMFFRGMKIGDVGVVCSLASAWALIPFAVGILILKEVVTPFQLFSVIVIMTGIFIASSDRKALHKFNFKQPGFKEGLVTLFLFGIVMTAVVPLAKNLGWVSAIVLLRLSTLPWIVALMWKELLKFPSIKFALAILVASLLDIGAICVYSYAAEGSQATALLAPLSASYPLVTTVLAYFFMKEHLGPWKLFGICTIVFGISMLGFLGG